MSHATELNKDFEFFSNELRTVVRDNPWDLSRKEFTSSLNDNLNVGFFYSDPYLPMNDQSTVAIEEAAQVIENPRDIDLKTLLGLTATMFSSSIR